MIAIWIAFLSVANGYYMPSNISIAPVSNEAIGLDKFYRIPFQSSKMDYYNYGNIMDNGNNFNQDDDLDYESSISRTDDYGILNELTDYSNSKSSDDAFEDDSFLNNEDSDFDTNKQVFRYKPVVKRSPQNKIIDSKYTIPDMNFNYGLIHNPQSINIPQNDKDNINNEFITSLRHPKQLAPINFPSNDIQSLFNSKPDRSNLKSEEFPKKLHKCVSDESRESNLKEIIYQEKPMDIWNNFLSEIMTMNKMQKSRINHLPEKAQNQEKSGNKEQDDDNAYDWNATESSPRNFTSRLHKYIPSIFKNMENQKRISSFRKGQRGSSSNKIKTSHTNEDLKKTSFNGLIQCSSNDMEMFESDEDYDDDANKRLFKNYKQSNQPKDEFLTVRLFEHLNNPFPNIFREIPPPSVVAKIANKDVFRKSKNTILGKDNKLYEFKFKRINTDPFPNLFFEKPDLEQEEFIIRKLPVKKPNSKNLN